MAENLRRLRRERGISQRQLADEAKVNSSVVNRAERGGNTAIETWIKLFSGLGYVVLFDVQELAEECGDLLAEEAQRRRDNRRWGLLKSGKILGWPY
ncbi:MAG: helix-turn-helix transcriptional regulator [Elusimicrobia bacterium]|nr:helix-turn-helix transcriptional regulator [Elusimicrobiota bacterium]